MVELVNYCNVFFCVCVCVLLPSNKSCTLLEPDFFEITLLFFFFSFLSLRLEGLLGSYHLQWRQGK